jgi:hypothetical protein
MTGNRELGSDGEPIVLDLLADLRDDRTEAANRDMVELALRIPDLLATLFAVRDGDDRAVAADSADTITKVAQRDPRVVLPYRAYVVHGLDSAIKQVRWESLTTLALLAAIEPGIVAPLVARLDGIVAEDASVIARDRAIDALASYGRSSPEAAHHVVPVLIAAVGRWNGKHAARALRSLQELGPLVPDMHPALRVIAAEQATSHRPSVRTAAKRLAVVVSPGR